MVVGGSFVVNHPYLILQAAIAGVGIANLAEMMVAAAISKGQLVPLLRNWQPRISGLFLYYSSRRQVPAPLQAFIAFMRRHNCTKLWQPEHPLCYPLPQLRGFDTRATHSLLQAVSIF